MTSIVALFIHRYRWGYQIRGDERGFLEKASEYKSLGIGIWAVEKRPSLEETLGENVYTSLSVGDVRLPIRNPIDLFVVILKSVRKLATLKVGRPVAIYAYNQDPENVVTGLVFKLILRAPLVIVYHHISALSLAPLGKGIVERRSRGYGLFASVWRSSVPALARFSAKAADVHLALSSSTKSEVELLLGVRSCAVIGNGVDTLKFRPLDVEMKYDAAFLGRMVHQKGIDTLLRAWSLVSKQQPNPRLILIGGGDRAELDHFLKIAREVGVLDLVEFRGFVADEEVVRLLSASRLFVFPSRREGFAQAVSQAMACGLCCVLSDIPSLREIYGDVAVFVPPDDPEELATCISRMLDDPVVRREYGVRAKQFVQKFDWRMVVERELSEINRCVRS
ncbi:MAG: glycosyltransferase [Nitrososphaerales archaeon]